MNYINIYDSLIKSRMLLKNKRIILKKQGSYFEKHHILPKCKGGGNEKSNIVVLTSREHFLAHRLLWKIYKDRQMALAFHMMTNINKNQNRVFSSRDYEAAREAYRKTNIGNTYGKANKGNIGYNKGGTNIEHSEKMSGENNPFYNKKHSKDTRKLIREAKIEYYKNNPPKGKLTSNTQTGIFYESAKEASDTLENVNKVNLQNWMRGLYKNKTDMIYC